MPPISVMIKPVSGLCNMRCQYCFYADELARRGQGIFAPMQEETLEKLIRRIFAYADGFVSLAFQGGEPTLAGAAFYRKVLELESVYNARSLPVHHAIQTNGLALDDELLSVLKKGRFLVGLSVDGTKEFHDARRRDWAGNGTYDRVMATAEKLRRAGIEYNILCVVGKTVARHPKEVFEALSPHGFLQFIPRLEPFEGAASGRAQENSGYIVDAETNVSDVLGAALENSSPEVLTADTQENHDPDALTAADYGHFLVETYKLYARALRSGHYVSVRAFDNWLNMLSGRLPENCGFAGHCVPNYLVESNGNVYPCDFYALDEWLLGNINQTNFKRLAASEKMREFCERSYKPDQACLACPYGGICHGGCRRDREPALPDGSYGRNRLCEGYQMFFENCLEDMRALQREIAAGKVRI